MRCALVLVVVACSSSPPRPAPPSTTCPATEPDPALGGSCHPELQCAYGATRCACEPPCYGGAARKPESPGTPPDPWHWRCTPPRTDGCPDERPTHGSACSQNDQGCSYIERCAAIDYVCVEGAWVEHLPSPPA
jgi:hypothetical protein